MQIQINPGPGMQQSDALDEHVSARLERIDRRFGERLTRIEVHMTDVNGPKGGENKRVKLEARPRGLDPVLAEATEESAYDAVNSAVDKLESVLASLFGKQDAKQRSTMS
ncbi:ribosomal subunit interface protein [Natronocella acetinitrilica]|uniref:Ribosomal subunit interface protein n=1 Tax=Natronocella acetinitrilica TaxID=414046 RepID=A0AAE3G6N8_9GAMM|nr:HPF/RaiA family ribosome-associated protein [Natronocella acetinitrilica]MCP1676118.1 ribosomal subunit interface protein [Natronocella acetinitrilica]